MDEAGVDAAAVMTITDVPGVNPQALELIANACAAYPQRMYAFARIHPWYQDEAVRLLDRAVTEFGFRGLKLHPVSNIAHPSGADTIRLIKAAAGHGVPTLFHCGDEPLTTPLSIAPAAQACPEATIILGHMGGYFHVDEAIEVADRYPNIILETSAMPYPDKIKEAVGRIGAERVIFGSDGPMCSPILEREKVQMAGLAPDELAQVLGGSAARLLGVAA
jgi:predicted TIM-barrel fold metal-dependent hydrolase